MKTIEERAKDFSPDAINPDEILPVRAGHIVEKERRAYRVGAKEQREIDILKICKWFCKTCIGQCKGQTFCENLQEFRNELNAIEE